MPTNMTGIDRKYLIDKAVEFDKTSKDVQKCYGSAQAAADSGDYIGQPKLDGCNGILVVDSANMDYRFFTRTGEEVLSCDHLINVAVQLPDGVYLGELYNAKLEQKEISGMVRKKKGQCPDLEFHVFDALSLTEWRAGKSERPFISRYAQLGGNVMPLGFHMVPLIDLGFGILDVEEYARNAPAKKQDGLIMRRIWSGWEAGRGTEGRIIKVKPSVTVDLECIGWYWGEGKFEGMAGGLIFRFKDGREARVGGGMTDAFRTNPSMSKYCGFIYEIEALGYTPDGELREPRIKCVRTDKEEADF